MHLTQLIKKLLIQLELGATNQMGSVSYLQLHRLKTLAMVRENLRYLNKDINHHCQISIMETRTNLVIIMDTCKVP